MINISNRGTYPFVFALVDSSGESTEIASLVFDIISRGVFESVDGELLDAAQVDEYQITVDFSVADEYVLSAMRTGTGGFLIKAYDTAGTECGELFTTAPSYSTFHKDSFTLEKPEGVTGAYTYTVKVTTNADKFVEGDTGYRFAYGQASQKFYFFEDVADAVNLPRFTPARNLSQVHNAFLNRTNPSEYGDYYRITATGPETVTLVGAEGLYRFKVLDATTLEPLYDGASLTPYNPGKVYTNVISVTINFAAGESYYIVVYNPQCSDTNANYSISVGERQLLSDYISVSIPQTSFVAGVPQIFTFTVNTPNRLPGYIDHVRLSTTMVGFHLSDSMYSVMTPGTNTWVNNMRHDTEIDFGFSDNQPLVGYNGEWQLRMIPTETGTFPASTLYIYYEFQI